LNSGRSPAPPGGVPPVLAALQPDERLARQQIDRLLAAAR